MTAKTVIAPESSATDAGESDHVAFIQPGPQVLANGSVSILIVEDEPAIAESLSYALAKEGFVTVAALSCRAAREAVASAGLIVLDLMLPDGSGFELIDELRSQGSRVPIIVLSSRDREVDRVQALEAGADDYVTKPFSPREVVARVRAVLRRLEPISVLPRAAANAPQFTINAETRRVAVLGQPLDLTRVEFDLLRTLVTGQGRVFTRLELIQQVWGSGYKITDRTIDSHVKSLRRKVVDAGADPNLIETVRGVGYRLAESELAP